MKLRSYIAELFGTFILVFAGTGAIVIDEVSGGRVSHVGVALTFGLAVMALVHSLGDVSGAHLNPAVTIGFWQARRFPGSQVPLYLVAQVSGALLASLLLHTIFPQSTTLGATLPAGSELQSAVLELVLTCVLMFVILSVSTGAKEKGLMAGTAIGAVVGLGALFAGPVSGASMNPARSLAPAVVSGQFGGLWVYLLAPTAGALSAVGLCRCIRGDACCTAPSEGCSVP